MDGDRVLVDDETPGRWAVWVCRCKTCGHRSINVTREESEPPFSCSACDQRTVVVDARHARTAREQLRAEAP